MTIGHTYASPPWMSKRTEEIQFSSFLGPKVQVDQIGWTTEFFGPEQDPMLG